MTKKTFPFFSLDFSTREGKDATYMDPKTLRIHLSPTLARIAYNVIDSERIIEWNGYFCIIFYICIAVKSEYWSWDTRAIINNDTL